MLGPQLLTAEPILSLESQYANGEIFSIYNDNFELGDMDESTLEDWKLPPSIEDEEAKPLDMTLHEARGTRDYHSSSTMLPILDHKLNMYRSLGSELAAPSPPSCRISFVLAIRQRASRACNSYPFSPKFPPLSRSFPSSSHFESRPQSDIENHESPINLSLDATTIVFISPNAVIAPIAIPKRCSSPSAPFSELQVHPRHLRRSSFSTSPIHVAELARLKEGFWDLEILEPSVDIIGEKGIDEGKYLVVARYPALPNILLE